MEEGPRFESRLMQRIFSLKKKMFLGNVGISGDYQMGAGAVWVIPIAMVLDINALGGVQGSTL